MACIIRRALICVLLAVASLVLGTSHGHASRASHQTSNRQAHGHACRHAYPTS